MKLTYPQKINQFNLDFFNTNNHAIEENVNVLSSTISNNKDRYNYKYIVLTDDDSQSSTYTTWYPLLQSFQIHGSISAIMFSNDYAGNCTKDQLLEMQENGFDIMNHSSSTDTITTVNMDTIIPYALTLAKNKGYQAAQRIFVFPNGNSDTNVETYVSSKFDIALGVQGTGNTNPMNFYNVNRINVDDSNDQSTITSYVYNQVAKSDMTILCTHSYHGVSNLTAIIEHYIDDDTVKFVSMTEYINLFNVYDLSDERKYSKSNLEAFSTTVIKSLDSIFEEVVLFKDKTVHVATTGNDDTGDGTSESPYATIQKAIDTVPKNLSGYTATIIIDAGTYTENVDINGFHGSTLALSASSDVEVTINGSTTIRNCQYVYNSIFSSLTFSSTSGIPLAISNSNVRFDANTVISGSASYSGIVVDNGGTVKLGNTIINNCDKAIEATRQGRFYASSIDGTGNNTGINGSNGAIISYGAETISATTNHTLASGAIITNLITMA